MTAPQRLEPQPWMTAPATLAVLKALKAGGAEVRFVGGCVRDALLGRAVKDIDLGTTETPDVVLRRLKDAGIHAVPTGIEHGTVTAVAEHRPFEVTTLRRDISTDGRRAVVAFTADWREDASRRDFSFNAMSCAPDGTLYDYFGGREDLRAGRVRFVGDAEMRIREDVMRLLRFFRFNAHYGKGAPDAEGLDACRRLAPLLPTLSGERLQQETLRLLEAPDPAPILRLMREAGVLAAYLAEAGRLDRLAALIGIEAAAKPGADPVRRLAALIGGGKAAALAVAERLRLSNDARDRLALLADPPVALTPALMGADRRRAFNRLGDAGRRDALLMAWAEAASNGALPRSAADSWAAFLADALAWRRRELPIKGRDALALGVKPGPKVGELIAAVEAWWEAGDFKAGREECLAELKRRI
ncbi:MAG: CCA tRNA nucleotidyltransferase [Rhodospirillales bacterium]